MKSPSIVPSMPRGRDYMTRYGAGVLAEIIENYWRKKGYEGVRTERYELPASDGVYGVRSNLINGLPSRDSRVKRRKVAMA